MGKRRNIWGAGCCEYLSATARGQIVHEGLLGIEKSEVVVSGLHRWVS